VVHAGVHREGRGQALGREPFVHPVEGAEDAAVVVAQPEAQVLGRGSIRQAV
jgi:hypothetical protein